MKRGGGTTPSSKKSSSSSSSSNAANLVSPIDDITAFNGNDLASQIEKRIHSKEAIQREKIAMRTKEMEWRKEVKVREMEMRAAEQERAFKLQEQQMQMQTVMLRFLESTAATNRAAPDADRSTARGTKNFFDDDDNKENHGN